MVKRKWHSPAYKARSSELLQKRIRQLNCVSTITWIIGRLSHAHGTYNLAMAALRHFQPSVALNPKYSHNRTQLLIQRNSQHNQSNYEMPHKNLLHHAQLQPPFRKTQQTDRHGAPGPAALYQRKTLRAGVSKKCKCCTEHRYSFLCYSKKFLVALIGASNRLKPFRLLHTILGIVVHPAACFQTHCRS